MALVCGQCHNREPHDVGGLWWQDRWFCSAVCSHAAGDRMACHIGCGCTSYAKKRRWLRGHRVELRIARDLLAERGLTEELETRLMVETGSTGYWLDLNEELDEASDVEDPEATLRVEVADLRAEASDRTSMVQAVAGALQCRARELESRERSRSPRATQS